jgi:hypothetical protein
MAMEDGDCATIGASFEAKTNHGEVDCLQHGCQR